MKKYIIFVLALVLLTGLLSGCTDRGNVSDDTNGEITTESSQPTSASSEQTTRPSLSESTGTSDSENGSNGGDMGENGGTGGDMGSTGESTDDSIGARSRGTLYR